MMKVLVTGGSGFIGTNLVEHYTNLGFHVVNIDVAMPRNPAHLPYWAQLDIRDGGRLREAVQRFSPNLILHMAARTDLDGHSLSDYSANTEGVKAVIQAAVCLPNLTRVVFASSMLVCALGYRPKHESDYCPTTRYGESKVAGERYVRELATGQFPWTIVRPTSLWGPWFGVPYKNFFDAVAKRKYLHPKERKVHRSYGFVLNSIHQLTRIASCEDQGLVDGKILYLADYQPIELWQWARAISERFGVPPPREAPVGLLRCFAVVGDALGRMGIVRHPPLTSSRLRNLLTDAVFDLRVLESIAGTLPYDLEQGVAATVDWIQRSGQQ